MPNFIPNGLKSNFLIYIIVAAYLLVYFFFFPSFYSSSDEQHILAKALQFRHFQLGEKDPLNVCNAGLYTNNGYVYGHYIGRPLFLIPFAFFGFNAVMLSGLIIHLLNFALLLLIFKKLKINQIFALLYLFYPVIFWQSRTLYAGILVLTGFLAAFYFYLSNKEKHWVLSGVFLGLAMLARYDAALGIGAILLALLIKNRKKLLFVLAGFLPVLFAIVLFNTFAYGSPVGTGYGHSGTGLLYSTIFGADVVSIIFYITMLLLLYPLMFASPYLLRKFNFKLEFALFSIAYLFFAARYNPFHFDISLFTLPLRMRYGLPLAGMLIIPYGLFLQKILEKYKSKEKLLLAGYWLFIVLLFAGIIFASHIHAKFLNERRAVFEQIYANTPENALIIGSSDDCMYFLNGMFPKRRYLNIDLEQGLAGNPQNLSIEQFIDDKTYVLELRYGNRSGRESARQHVIEKEREKIKEFIEKNKDRLQLVFETDKPHYLKIYRFERFK